MGVSAKARFGTFAGVVTPNVLTILGIIYFLYPMRLPVTTEEDVNRDGRKPSPM